VTGLLLAGVRLMVILLWVSMLGRVVLSWADPETRTRPGLLAYRLTEPILAPIRGVLPRTGTLDLAPLLVLLVLGLLLRVVG
jgi:YggT family protein